MSEYKLDLNNYINEPPKPITYEMFNILIKQRDQFHAERDNCLKDIEQLRECNRELERESKQKSIILSLLDKENERDKPFLSEISQHIGHKPSSSTYKMFRKKLDDIGIKERK